jgi:hypothetical protein
VGVQARMEKVVQMKKVLYALAFILLAFPAYLLVRLEIEEWHWNKYGKLPTRKV